MALARVELRTRWLPPIAFDVDAPSGTEPGAPGAAGWLLAQLRPAVTVVTPVGAWSRAPYGEPGESRWHVAAAVTVALLVAAFVGVRAVLRSRR